MASKIEYEVWGITGGDPEPQCLIARFKGEPITDRKLAEAAANWCVNRGAGDVQIRGCEMTPEACAALGRAFSGR